MACFIMANRYGAYLIMIWGDFPYSTIKIYVVGAH